MHLLALLSKATPACYPEYLPCAVKVSPGFSCPALCLPYGGCSSLEKASLFLFHIEEPMGQQLFPYCVRVVELDTVSSLSYEGISLWHAHEKAGCSLTQTPVFVVS